MERLMAEGNDEHRARIGHGAPGWIEVIAGSMFSGKSEELIRRLRRAKIARLKVQVFKPEIDVRYSRDHIVSHSEMRHESRVARTAAEILAQVEPDTQVVGIDEGQFFDDALVEVANTLAHRGLRVIVAGLDQDYTGKPFEPMPQLLASPSTLRRRTASAAAAARPRTTRSASSGAGGQSASAVRAHTERGSRASSF